MLLTNVSRCFSHSVKAFVFCLTVAVLAACCGLADQSPSSLKQCNHLFKADKFSLLMETKEFFYQDEAPNEASCTIANSADGKSLVLNFKMLFMVSGVLMDETTFGNAIGTIKVLLWSGSNSMECKLVGNDVVKLSDGRRLVKFLCYHSGGIAGPANDKNIAANQIEITSTTPVTMNLTKIKKDFSFGFITREVAGVDENNRNDSGGCEPPPLYDDQFAKPEKNYYMPMEKVCICCKNKDGASASQHAHYTCQTNGSWSYDDRPLSKCNSQSSLMDAITRKPVEDNHYQAPPWCPPFEAYDGMPHNYTNYAYTVDRSINEKLLKFPCREGYEFVGKRSDINQCNKNGNWQGKGFPVCQVVATKLPPLVANGNWVIEKNGTALMAVYTCQFFHYLNGSGNASYSNLHEEWINVPKCLLDWEYVIPTAIGAFIMFVIFVAVFSKCWNMITEKRGYGILMVR